MQQGEDLLEPVLNYYLNPENRYLFGGEIQKAMTEFSGSESRLSEDSFFYFTDWFLFDFSLFGKETPLAAFCKSNPLSFPEERLNIYKKIESGNVFDFFEIVENRKNNVVVKPLHREGQFALKNLGKHDLPVKGGIVVCRIIPVNSWYEIVSIESVAMDAPSKNDLKKMKNDFQKIDSRIFYNEVAEDIDRQNFEAQKINDKTLVSANYDGGHFEKYDDCPICQLMKKTEEEGRQPTEKELQTAFAEAEKEKNWNKLTEPADDIAVKRKEIEQELLEMLNETKSDFSLQDIKDTIYNEEDSDDLMKVVAMFDRGGDSSELDNILEVTNDAWNYFPHKTLDGLCPMEKVFKYQRGQKKPKI